MSLRNRWIASAAVAAAICLGQIGPARAQQPVAASGQAGSAPASSGQAAATTTFVPQNQIVYETVYDTECYLVPTTQMRTDYKTECKTETVPVTTTVYDQVPTTELRNEYRTEYKTKTVPVTRTVVDQIPSTVMQTKYRTEYKTKTVPVTRTVMDQIPTTQTQTRYRTEYKTRTIPVTRSVPETMNVPRSYTIYVPVQKTVNQQVFRTTLEPVTRTEKRQRYLTVMKTVPQTSYEAKTVSFTTSRVETALVPECYTETVPVTTYRQVVQEQGCYRTVCIPIVSRLAAEACSLDAVAAAVGRRAGAGILPARGARRRIPISRFSSRGQLSARSPRRATCSKHARGWFPSRRSSKCLKRAPSTCP